MNNQEKEKQAERLLAKWEQANMDILSMELEMNGVMERIKNKREYQEMILKEVTNILQEVKLL